jgi:hypothetical protein
MFNLFIPWYNDKAIFRQQELDWCLLHNITSGIIDNIFLFPESRRNILPKLNEKVNIIHLDKRVTYLDIIKYINSEIRCYKSFNIISNIDIYFNDTLNLLHNINMDRVCLSLTRWETNPLNNPGNLERHMTYQSCDVWIFKSYIFPNIDCDFYFGLPGCEGRFNFELQKVGYKIYNPSEDIKVLHYHVSGKRNWSELDRLQGDTINPPIISIKELYGRF